MKKQLLGKVFTAIIFLAVSACLVNLQGQVSVSLMNDSADIGGGSTGTISPLTLNFEINDEGKISMDAFSGNQDSLVMAVVDRWDSDSVGVTEDTTIFGYSFSLVASVVDGGDRLQSRESYGGGLGVRGKNQWRIDDSGTEFMHFQLLGQVGLEFTEFAYNSVNGGAYGQANLRFIDYDSDKTYLIDNPVLTGDTVYTLPAGDLSMRHSYDSLTVTTSDTLTGGDGNEGACLYGFTFNVTAAAPKVLPPGQISIDFFNDIEKDVGNTATGGLDVLTLDFSIDGTGKISVDATTENDNADVVAVVNAWDSDNVGSTDNPTLYNTTFSLVATTSDRIQCDAEGGLGVQGRNQWRFDDAGTEFIYWELSGDVGLEFISMKYNSLNGGSSEIPGGVGNLRFIDYDSDYTYILQQPQLDPYSEFIFPADDVLLRYKTDVVTVTTSDTMSMSDGNEGARLYGLVLNVVEPVLKPPAVLSTSPANADTLVAVNSDYVIVFDNPMNQAVSEAAVSITPAVSNRVNTWDAEGEALTISFDNLSFYTQYTVTVGAAIQGANELLALGDTTFVFQTLPDAPTVISTYPVDGAENVPAGTPLIMEFSREMNPEAVEAALSFDPALTDLSFSWNGAGTKAIVSSAEMMPSTVYTVTLSADAADAYGVLFAEPVVYSFTTATPVSVRNAQLQDVELYPNPVSEVLHIRGVDISAVNIHSLTGQLMKSIVNSKEINLSDIEPGSYVVTVADSDQNSVRKLIVVQ